MTYKRSLLLAIAIVVPLTLLLWLTFSPVLFIALYPGLKVQLAITAMHSNAQGAWLGFGCGAAVNTLLYSVATFSLAKVRDRMHNRVLNSRAARTPRGTQKKLDQN